ncbi:MAG TPA: acetyl-CoA C-acetyltransferase [Holosporales bacterium]|nr:acetyl-CoA C-acetyltransferase [Holosporales bacterium]
MNGSSVVIMASNRTPIGAFQGGMKSLTATNLGAEAIKGLMKKVTHNNFSIDDVILGCVIQAGLGQAPARQAVLKAGLSHSISATTINKVCGSGMRSVMYGVDQIQSGHSVSVIAGGMESMSNAPYLLPKARSGLRMGHGQVVDSLFFDGLEDACGDNLPSPRTLMGAFAEATAEKYNLSRAMQEEFVIETFEKYHQNIHHHQKEITPITFDSGYGVMVTINQDEPPQKVIVNKFSSLRPVFKKEGTVTAATSSSLADGAAALLLMHEAHAKKQELPIEAHIIGTAQYAHAPEWFTTAPVGAIKNLLSKIGWNINSVDLFEINEAFAVVPMVAMQELSIPRDKINVFGGACTIGHPIGCSGTRIIVTLINALRCKNLKRGIAAVCIGGGEALALAIEVNE